MKSRGLVVVLALILATLAVVGLFLYTRSVKEDAEGGGAQTEVIVSKIDIPTNSDLNALINQGQFTVVAVPTDRLVEGAITNIEQMRNRRNNTFILADEQIPISRVQGGKVQGGVIGIPEGYQAITVSLDAPRAVSGAIAAGDNVTIYATFTDVIVSGGTKGQQTTTAALQQGERTTVTTVLVPEVQVLRIYTLATGGTTGNNQAVAGEVTVTMALLPEDAQSFVLALEQGSVWLSLLPPDEQGTALDPLTVAQVLEPTKSK